MQVITANAQGLWGKPKRFDVFECGRARSHSLACENPAPEGWPTTGATGFVGFVIKQKLTAKNKKLLRSAR